VRPDGLKERGALPEPVGLVNALAFAPGGGPLASGSGHCLGYEGVAGWFCAVRLWDVGGRPREHVPRGGTPVYRTFHDAGQLASLSLPGTELIWDLSGERPRLVARLGVSGAKHWAWLSGDHTRALLENLDPERREVSVWSLGPGGPRCKGTVAAEAFRP